MFNTTRFCKTVLAAALVAFIIAPGPAKARSPASRVDVEIVDRSEGRVLPIYKHDGRRYVLASQATNTPCACATRAVGAR